MAHGRNTPSVPAVLIVPLWNWKVTKGYAVAVAETVLIVPLWNWKSSRPEAVEGVAVGLNCTFMELKVVSLVRLSIEVMS